MATPASASDQPSTGTIVTSSTPQPASSRPTSSGNAALSTSPVELRTLPAASATEPQSTTNTPAPAASEVPAAHTSIGDTSHQAQEQDAQIAPVSAAPAKADEVAPPTNLARAESEPIGPSTDTPTINPDPTNGPVVVIMLLLTTGARHPYKIDERYLKKRNITVDAMDPYNISVYTLKELIWRDWREEWEPRPTSPSSIRLIHFGRMLDDKSPLKDCRFNTEAPNVVHMTVKPQEIVDEEDAKTGKSGARRDGDEESHAGCRCVIL